MSTSTPPGCGDRGVLTRRIALKRLLRQTLSHDDHLVDVHPLAEVILAEGTRLKAGSTIKTDGEESDPWGLLAAVDVNRCQVSACPHSSEPLLLQRNYYKRSHALSKWRWPGGRGVEAYMKQLASLLLSS